MKRLVLAVPKDLTALLHERFDDEDALAEGRVFLRYPADRAPRRARESDREQPLAAECEVQVYPRRAALTGNEKISILHQEDGIIAVSKPAGIPTIPDQGGSEGALQTEVANYLRLPLAKVHPTSRLDREVSGVVVFALDGVARVVLSDARAAGSYQRRYVAIACHKGSTGPRVPGRAVGETFRVDVPIGRDRDPKRRKANGRDPAPAASTIEVLARAEHSGKTVYALALFPETGRTHQLRIHAAHSGMPLLGDRAYGGETRLTKSDGSVTALDRIALHAAEIRVPLLAAAQEFASHDGEHAAQLHLRAEIPPFFQELWAQFSEEEVPWYLPSKALL